MPTRISGDTKPAITVTRKSIERRILGVGGVGELQLEWFILPRLALDIGVRGTWLLPFDSFLGPGMTSTTDHENYPSTDNRSSLNFGLNPFMLPDGTMWSDTLFSTAYVSAYIGFAVYF